jgi:hypothetical protein
MPRDILNLLEAGNKAQLEKLNENDHKNDFDSLELPYIFKRITEEKNELCNELVEDVIDYSKARREFADIANFAHMGILACDKELSK